MKTVLCISLLFLSSLSLLKAECTNGEMKCGSKPTQYEHCSNGQWMTIDCGDGTVCAKQGEQGVICTFPEKSADTNPGTGMDSAKQSKPNDPVPAVESTDISDTDEDRVEGADTDTDTNGNDDKMEVNDGANKDDGKNSAKNDMNGSKKVGSVASETPGMVRKRMMDFS
ncbi:hypothetical protein K7432_014210 [Basidiobolus ranarum]|uniref:Uncharacterized protein n=1 Tax=Basidiobolus ranarum TaxID=34480 RepID=A0ABR2WHY3_9FUNG